MTGPTRLLSLLIIAAFVLAACSEQVPEFAVDTPQTVTLTADGQTQELTTQAANVRELLSEANIDIGDTDIVDPPPFTPLSDGLQIAIIRVTESVEFIEQVIPFQRKSVRNESMSADAAPIIIQGGQAGLQEITVRIVYHDGLEFERRTTRVTVVEEPQDEIVMIGVGAAPGNVSFAGSLAFISGGNSVILRGSSAFPEQIDTGANLDQRVFSLSPTGSHLLYTRTTTDTTKFNSLWIIGTDRGASPRPLEIDNVLWADWNPAATQTLQIAYTTGEPTDLLPGWEANNDLWLGDIPGPTADFEPRQLVEAYPATYGWWGGNFAWAPAGRYIAYSYADEVGLIDIEAPPETSQRRQLATFIEYNTRADWVWVPTLAWSPDSRYIAFTGHAGDDPDGTLFDTWVVDAENGIAGRFITQTGIWSHPFWSPVINVSLDAGQIDRPILFLRATNPLDSLRSSYTLWLMDSDGSNARQIYPPIGENSRFPRDRQFMAWSATGEDIAFVYDDALYILNLVSGEARRITQDDTVISSPTWAPYGLAITGDLSQTEVVPEAKSTPIPGGFQTDN